LILTVIIIIVIIILVLVDVLLLLVIRITSVRESVNEGSVFGVFLLHKGRIFLMSSSSRSSSVSSSMSWKKQQ